MLGKWINRNRILLAVTTVFVLLSLPWLFPITENVYVLRQTIVKAIWLAIGVIGTPYVIFLRLSSSNFTVFMLFLLGLLIGVFVQLWWRRGRRFKLVAGSIVFANAFVMFVVSDIGIGPSVSPLPAWYSFDPFCQQMVTELNGIRVASYSRFDDTADVFLLFTTDGGLSWRDFGYFVIPDDRSYGNYVGAACRNVSIFTPEMWGGWVTHQIFVTRDGGKSWELWDVCDRVAETELRESCHDGFAEITMMSFTTQEIAALKLFHANRVIQLNTVDGGLTWHITE